MQKLIDLNFKEKTVGFYLSVAAAILSILLAIVYACGYNHSVYMSWTVFALALIAGIVFFILAIFKPTQPFAAVVMEVLVFLSFLVFIRTVYMYFSEVFYGGFSFSGLSNVNPIFYTCLILFILSIVLSNIGIYAKFNKTAKSVEEAK